VNLSQQAPAGRPVRRAGPALGNPANSKAVAPEKELAGTVHDPRQGQRWRLQRAAQHILSDTKPREGGLAFVYRVSMCQRGGTGQGARKINRNPEGTRAAYRNLQTCGSVWHCPICAPKIATGRCREMDSAIGQHGIDRRIYFITYTVQHDRDDSGSGQLGAQLGCLRKSLSRAKASRAWREVMTRAGSIGSIRALEITYGEMNGWHSHAHEIRFAEPGGLVVDREGKTVRWLSPLYALSRLWVRELIARNVAGLDPLDAPLDRRKKLRSLLVRGLTVQDGTYAARYVAEFGTAPEKGLWVSGELALSHIKTARRTGHCTPWGLLADALGGDARSRDLFREYAKELHGVPQLYWSRGLKAHFKIEDIEDDSLAAEPDKTCSQFVAIVDDEDWSRVLRYNARFELLRAAAIDGPLGVSAYLLDLKESERGGLSPPSFSGLFQRHPRDFFPDRFKVAA